MSTRPGQIAAAARPLPPSPLTAAVLVWGPPAAVATALGAVHAGVLGPLAPATYLWAAVLLFSPLPLSLAALLLDGHRDAVLPHWTGPRRVARAVLLLPVLLSAASPVRALTARWLLSWAASAAAVAALTR